MQTIKENKEKDEQIKALQEQLKQPRSITKNKTKNITNNITNNNLTIYEVMTPERVEDFFKKHYNLDTLMEGMSGLARFICDGFIREKASYHCTDRSRHKFIMKDEDGNSVEDTNCEELVSIGGVSIGSLQKYRDGYKARKEKANGEVVAIKGPKALMELCEIDKDLKTQYIHFITKP
jgi:hypothetical protein